jgi:hypothetical protein
MEYNAEWYKDMNTCNEFASWYEATQGWNNISHVLEFYQKPYKYDEEYHEYCAHYEKFISEN